MEKKSKQQLLSEIEDLRDQLSEARETLRAIRHGEVDAFVVSGPDGDHVYALKSADYTYRLLVERMNEGAITLGHDGTIFYCNRRFAEMLKTPANKVVGSSILEYIEPEQRDELLRLFRQSETASFVTETDFKASDGTKIPVLLASGPLLVNDLAGSCITATDLTERKRAEDALREANATLGQRVVERTAELAAARNEAIGEKNRLEAVMEALPVGVAITDLAGGNIQSNAAYEQVWGSPRPPTDSISDYAAYKAWWADTGRAVAPEEWASARAVQGGESVVGQLVEIERFDGSRAFVINSASPVRDAQEGIIGSAVAIQDITDLRKAEQALRESEERFRLFMDNSPIIAWMKDEQGRHVYFNKTYEDRFGAKLADWLGKTDFEVWPEETAEEFRKNDQAVLAAGHAIEVTEETINLDGSLCSWLNSKFPFRDVSGRQYVAGIGLDITERKLAETLLRIHRDLALALGSTSSMTEALEHLLQATLQIEGFDSGGVYLMDAASGELRLISHVGLSAEFIEQVSCYGPATPQTRFVMQGEPIYWPTFGGDFGVGALIEREELTSLAVIPIKSRGQVVAALNLASRTQREIPESTKSEIETIAAKIGGVVSRVSAEEALKIERQNLAEANAALKVILQHQQEDRRGFEESLLSNVKNLVMPYVEKLVKTRLGSDQVLLLEIIESNLREIASPFQRRLSHPLIKLTPMETRVADLIRSGRTTKETAEILRTSARSVRFHRENIRGKLGLKSNKVNLRSYLSSLA